MTTADPDGRGLVIVKDGTTALVADLATGERLSALEHEYTMNPFAVIEYRGRVTAVTVSTCDLHVWDVATGKRAEPLEVKPSLSALALTEIDGRLVAAGAAHDRTVRTWDLTEGRPYHAPLALPEDVQHLAFTRQA